jgi:hypothetical protein
MNDGPTPGQRRPRIPKRLIGPLHGLGPDAGPNPLVEERVKLVKQLYTEHRYTAQEIARMFKISSAAIHGYLSSDLAGAPVERRSRVTTFGAKAAEDILSSRRLGVPIAELARRYGTTPGSVTTWLYRQRKQGADLPLHPERNQEK